MSNVRSYRGTESLPTCAQIDRACRILESHEDRGEFARAFDGELTPEATFLAFHAGRAAFEVNARLFDIMGNWKGERGDRAKDTKR
jgi:hypothetical protein